MKKTYLNDEQFGLLEYISQEIKRECPQWIEKMLDDLLHNVDQTSDFADYTKLYFSKKYHVNISQSVEKHNVLQYTHYVEIESALLNVVLFLEIENGINNGTVLREFSFESDMIPDSRIIDVLDDVVLDELEYKIGRFSLEKAKAVFPQYKSEIIKKLKNQSYDNYVTGGGTSKTDKHYNDFFNSLENMGLFWKAIYVQKEVDLNIV